MLFCGQQDYPWTLGPTLSPTGQANSPGHSSRSRELIQSPVTIPKALWAISEAGGGPGGVHVQGLLRKAPSRGPRHILTLIGQ